MAARVVVSGAGVRVSPGATPEELRNTVRDVLYSPWFRLKAQDLAARIAAECAEERDVAELERLAARGPAAAVAV